MYQQNGYQRQQNGYQQAKPQQMGGNPNNYQNPNQYTNYNQYQPNYNHQHHNTNTNAPQMNGGNLGNPYPGYFPQSGSTGNLNMQPYMNGMGSHASHASHSVGNLNRVKSADNGAPPPPPPPSGPPPPKKKKKREKKKHHKKQPPSRPAPKNMSTSPQQQSMNGGQQGGYPPQNNTQSTPWNQPIQNSYQSMSNPAAVFQSMQNGSFMGSQMGSQMNMGQPMGSQRNFNASQQGYGIGAPPAEFVSQFGASGYIAQQQSGHHFGHNAFFNPNNMYPNSAQPVYYTAQPQGGGDSIVPPPPMAMAANGELIPTTKKKKKRKHGKHSKKHGKHKHRHSKDKDGKKRRRHKHRDKDGKKEKRSRSRDKDGKRKKKSSSKTKKSGDESPPPPPPPSGRLLPPVPGGGVGTGDDDEGSSSSSSTSDSDDFKGPLADNGNIPDASAVFKEQVNAQKNNKDSKKKGKHGRFESKSQFIRRRPVSGVPMSVLHGIKDDKVSSHLKLIHTKDTTKTKDGCKFLKECLLKEVLFQGMDDSMINEIVDVMYLVDCPKGECIIRQNEYGDAYFVIQSGSFDIIHQEMETGPQKIVGEMLPGKAFGEGSLLYSIPRAATLKATKACVVWALDATKFLEIRQKISQQVNDKTSSIVRHLKKIELFKKYHHQDLVAIGQAVIERKYAKNARIVNQGDEANEFYLIKTGAAIAVITTQDGKEQTVKKYSDGDFFGERGIYKNEKRAASIIATSTTRCYAIKAADFTKLLADPLSKQFEETFKSYDEIAFDNGIKRPFQNLIQCKLETFKGNTLGILGVGSFGRVSLVKDPQTNVTYSLKKVRKNKVIETGQQEHVRNERAVLATLDSDFCVKLFGTYQDELNIYFLMEPVLGGELFTVLRWNKRFSEKTARFYAACVVLAFESLHSKNIIYRDLKPENLLIAKNGYCKLVDFGFAKKRNNSCTLCGTPEYLSPEVIQNYSQGFAVDWWALGIFVYEMVVGHAPFQDDPNVKMYEKILTYELEFSDDPKLTPRVQHLILGLLEKNSFQRLGAGTNGTGQILHHPWFQGLNWEEMRQQKIAPPYVPNIVDGEDLSHYDEYPDENIVEKLDPDPAVYEWCEDF